MQKQCYISPQIELLLYAEADVIATSGEINLAGTDNIFFFGDFMDGGE